MKLYLTQRSPFARKVLITAIEKGLMNDIECITVDLGHKPEDLLNSNPLGKIPALIGRDGVAYCESPVICEYLDSLSAPYLMPQDKHARVKMLSLCALADGLTTLAVDHFKETMRPEAVQSDSVKKRLRQSIQRTLSHIQDSVLDDFGPNITPATIALVSALGYVNFRLSDLEWPRTYLALNEWYSSFLNRESVQQTAPKAMDVEG